MITDEVCFVKNHNSLFVSELRKKGFDVHHPYKDRTIIGRIIREVWFRVHLPQSIWFDRSVLKGAKKYILVEDTLITQQYLMWIKNNCPSSQIGFYYNNLVGHAKHIVPDKIPEGIIGITYDKHDSLQYGLTLIENGYYLFGNNMVKNKLEYDVLFVGRDKGRLQDLLILKSEFEKRGLVTKFLIMPNGRFSKHNKSYSKVVPYETIVSYLSKTRSVLNLCLPNQKGITIRDYESLFGRIKLITNNENIKEALFYCQENVFILNKDSLDRLPEFIYSDYKELDSDVLEQYSIENYCKRVISILN